MRDGSQTSALNAYLDVWIQVGLIGLFAFVFMVALAFAGSWLLASRQRSFVYAWPARVGCPGRWISLPVTVLGADLVVAVAAHVNLAQVDDSRSVGQAVHDRVRRDAVG